MAHKSSSRKIESRSKPTKQKKFTKVPEPETTTTEGSITAALIKVRDEKLALLNHTVESLKENPGANAIKAKAVQCKKLAEDVNELMGWIFPPREPMSFDRAVSVAQGMRDFGIPEDLVKWSLKVAQQRDIGRPPAMRMVSIKAIEIKQAEPSKSWMYLATKLCPCSKPKHDSQCRENLRQAVYYLRAFLTKHGVTF